jgi:arabinose-5-phosphate isomerase
MDSFAAASDANQSPAILGKQALQAQSQALNALAFSLNGAFDKTVNAILISTDYLVISAMGKSELTGRKMADMFSGMGRPSIFVHPTEILDGNSEMIRSHSLVVLISTSGENCQLLNLVPSLQKLNGKIIAIVGERNSTLAKEADIVLAVPHQSEDCLKKMMPDPITNIIMAIGNTTAAALMRMQKFKPVYFMQNSTKAPPFNPLLSKVRDIMQRRTEKDLPIIAPIATAREVIGAMVQSRMGLVIVMDDELLTGIITDSDLQFAMRNASFSMNESTAADIMHWNPPTISEDALLSDAEDMMSQQKLKALVALDNQSRVSGVIEIF